MKLWKTFKKKCSYFADGFKDKSIEKILQELEEMENGFALLICGSLIGLPAPPSLLTLRLLPYLEREIKIMLSKSIYLDDKLAMWAEMIEL
ncbi:MAG: hypothetical protein LWW95_04325 [Candidatus Desulfofervidus auxilii]|nr:hypothetical protein [Candidatus Desulfofervidus auxilii]